MKIPQDKAAEICLLGSMILDSNCIDDAVLVVSENQFYLPAHAQVFSAIVSMHNSGKAVDLVTLRDELSTRQALAAIGGQDYLVQLIDSVPNTANAEHYARIIRDKAILRGLIAASGDIKRAATQSADSAMEILGQAERDILALAENQTGDSISSMKDVVQESLSNLSGLDQKDGIPTGFRKLDDMTGGFKGGQMIVVAARPSMGKTALALNIMEHIGCYANMPVLLFSLEMDKVQITNRLLASMSQVDQYQMRHKCINSDGWTAIHRQAATLESSKIFIDDSPEISILEMRAKARRMKRQYGIRCVIIDYLQLVKPPKTDNRQEQVSQMSRQIKLMARELDLPVITLAQLNRAVEERVGHRPRKSDLRESGSIEQDADIICLLHRPDYYDKQAEPDMAELILDKQRDGPIGTIKLMFLKDYARFENLFEEI